VSRGWVALVEHRPSLVSVTEEEYKAMSDEMKPEILRENLGPVMLKL